MTAGTIVPPLSLVLGVPGKVVKTLNPEEADFHRKLAGKYLQAALGERDERRGAEARRRGGTH